MESVSVKFIAKQLLKYLWLAVLVGILFAAGFFLKNRADSDSVPVETEPAETIVETETKEAKTFADYRGDYLTQPETHRYAVYHLKWESDPVLPLTNTTWKLGDFSWEIIDYISRRLTSAAFSHEWYQTMSKQFPEIKENQKAFSVLIVEQEMLSVSVDHRANLWIDVRAPLSLNSTEEVYTEKQLCAYRDCLYRLVAATVDSGVLTEDLAVSLERVDPVVEDSLSEQVYVVYSLPDETGTKEIDLEERELANSGPDFRKVAVYMLIGILLVEAGVALAALLNTKVKDAEDLQRNTDLSVLDTITSKNDEEKWAVSALKIGAVLEGEETLCLLSTETAAPAPEDEASQLQAALAHEGFSSISVKAMTDPNESVEELRRLDRAKVLLLVRSMHSKYDKLRSLAETLKQMNASVIGAVVVQNERK